MRDVAEIVIPWAILTALLFALLDWDESRLDDEALARAWPPASRTLALVYFGLLSLPLHFARTRRSPLGLLQGFGWALGAFLADWALSEGVDVLPEGWLGPLLALVLGAFTLHMTHRAVKRSRRGGPPLVLPMGGGR
jgi:hypothetical protein